MSKQILAPMTGTVCQVLISVGDVIGAGDTLAILESMKMEIPVESEHAGVVASVQVSEGAVIEEGASIVTLE